MRLFGRVIATAKIIRTSILFFVVTIPAIWAAVGGYFDGLTWPAIVIDLLLVLILALLAAAILIWIVEKLMASVETRAEQKRIAHALNSYIKSGIGQDIDLPTAAAIWSGSRDEGNYKRHLCFRELKGYTNRKIIPRAKRLAPNGKATIGTTVPLTELARFFIREGVVLSSDIDPLDE